MSLRTRMILLISLLLAGSVLVTTALLTQNARTTMLEQQQESGQILARMLARTAFIVESFPAEMEDAIAEQMVIEATIASHFVAAAEAAGWTPEEINTRLREIVANTTLSEFWITDEKGHAYLRNAADIDFTFSPDPVAQPQAYVFYDLITGRQKIVIQQAARRDYDQKIFKYVGVGGVDKSRIVQVGYEANVLESLRERVSLNRLSKELVEGGDIRAIRVVNQGIETKVFQAGPGPGVKEELNLTDIEKLTGVLGTGQSTAYQDGGYLKVLEPVFGADDRTVSGAVMVYLPTDRMQAAILRQVTQAALVAAVILLIGAAASILLSRVVTRPVITLGRAAHAVEQGKYEPSLLQDVAARADELGDLGRVFDRMAQEVSARDRRFQLLKVIIPLGVSLSAEKDFNRLLETIVAESQKITHAEAGSLYLRTDDEKLKFVIVRNEPLGISLGGTSGKPVTFSPVPLYRENGEPNQNHIASHCALTGERVSIKDAYQSTEFDLSGTRAFDKATGFHSQSFMTIPLKDTADKVIGVLQLINARNDSGEVLPFAEDEVLDSVGLITSAALSAYVREESLRQEIDKLRVEIDLVKQTKQVQEIAESDYFQQLQAKAQLMKQKRAGK